MAVDCYQCRETAEKNQTPGFPVNQSVDEFFPFCSDKCKEEWGVNHFGPKQQKRKTKSIEECQRIILTEWKKRAEEERKLKIKSSENKDTYDVAMEIFGPEVI